MSGAAAMEICQRCSRLKLAVNQSRATDHHFVSFFFSRGTGAMLTLSTWYFARFVLIPCSERSIGLLEATNVVPAITMVGDFFSVKRVMPEGPRPCWAFLEEPSPAKLYPLWDVAAGKALSSATIISCGCGLTRVKPWKAGDSKSLVHV